MFLIFPLIILILAVLGISYYCFRIAFYVKRREKTDEIFVPEGEIYEPYHEDMIRWIKEVRAMPHENFEITSFDGLKLRAKYYEYEKGAPIEIMFHGYRGSAESDLSGAVQRCFNLKRNAFIVDQRCSGESEGNVITFGVNEHKDCLRWIDFVISHFGKEVKILITGISMGASTVMIAAGKELPENVVGALADCGYSSQKEIIKLVIKKMGLPKNLSYPFVKLAAKIYGHFDLEEITPIESLKNCKIPIIFIHGETDDFVPCYMSKDCFDVCPSKKMLVTVPDAGHGLAYLKDNPGYYKALREFFAE